MHPQFKRPFEVKYPHQTEISAFISIHQRLHSFFCIHRLFILLLAFWAGGASIALQAEEQLHLRYAENFTVEQTKAGKLVTVLSPWRDAVGSSRQYMLTREPEKHPDIHQHVPRIQVPCQRVIAASTTMIPHFEALNALDRLIGTADTRLVNTPSARALIKAGKIESMGQSASLNVERVVAAQPDVVLTSSAGDPQQDRHRRLSQAGVPVVLSASYMESHPLGRAEWIKFTALFLGLEKEAEEVFNQIAQRYENLRKKVREAAIEPPTVLFNVPWGGTWHMPSGESYRATFMQDAGADYLWKSTGRGGGSLKLDFETVYARAHRADVWLNTSQYHTLEALRDADSRYADFKAFRIKQIYNTNKRINEHGGNDIYERGTLHPEEVLSDYIKIFHPQLVPEHELIYHQHLPNQ